MEEQHVMVGEKVVKVVKNGLNLSGFRINHINQIIGLQDLTDLNALRLNDNSITEITGLFNVKNLEFLNLSQNQITKISGLEELTNLKNLDLSFNKIEKMEGLSNLTKLEYLTLDSNQIKEISNIEKCVNLKWLSLYENPIKEEHQKYLDQDVSVIRGILQAKVSEWKNSLISFYCMHSDMGSSLAHYDFIEVPKIDEQLFAGGLSGIVSLIQEMTSSNKRARVIDQEDKKILLASGEHVTCVLTCTKNLDTLHAKLKAICEEIETKYADELANFMGRRDVMNKGISEMIGKYFG